tara:strand:+ start:3385 stop:3966 length:582 start_codon:yes stop_codon:yes gene_type:complete
MNFNIYNYNKIPSTNDEAIQLIKKKNMKQGLVFSKIQTSGRGTRGKKWISKSGNFFGSVFFQLKKNTPKFYEFSVITPVLITKKIKEITDCKNIYIKWPNDIYINNQKVCGILQEVIQNGNNQKYLIIGIGINLVSHPTIRSQNISDIKKETTVLIKNNVMLNEIKKSFQNFFKNIKSYSYKKYMSLGNSLSR